MMQQDSTITRTTRPIKMRRTDEFADFVFLARGSPINSTPSEDFYELLCLIEVFEEVESLEVFDPVELELELVLDVFSVV